MFLLTVPPDVIGIAAFGISFLLLLGTILFVRHSKKELNEIGQPARKKNLRHLEQRSELAESLMLRLDEKQKELFHLQSRYNKLENRIEDVNYISLELEEAKVTIEQLNKDKLKREHRLTALMTENDEMRDEIFNLRKDLTEVAAEKQQLLKKISLMQDLESEWQVMAEKNHQLQSKVRRIGELESLLSLMKEEKRTGTLS
jgi:hypothetical protein